MAPLAFLRGVLCLNARYQKSSSCECCRRTATGTTLTRPGRAVLRAAEPDNVTIGVLSRLTHALDRADRAHAIKADMPVYLTEFGIQSKPNKQLGVAVAQQAEFQAISEHIAYSNPRVAAFSQYLLRDDPLGGSRDRAPTAASSAFRRAWRTRGTEAAVLRLPDTAGGHQRAARLLAVGSRTARYWRNAPDGARGATGLQKFRTLENRVHQLSGLLDAAFLGAGPLGA